MANNSNVPMARTMDAGAGVETSYSGGDATLDPGLPDLPDAGACRGEHKGPEAKGTGAIAPAGGGDLAAAAAGGAIEEEAQHPAHG